MFIEEAHRILEADINQTEEKQEDENVIEGDGEQLPEEGQEEAPQEIEEGGDDEEQGEYTPDEDELEEEPKGSKSFIKARKRAQEAEAQAKALLEENRQLSEKMANLDGKLDALMGINKSPQQAQEEVAPEFDDLNPQEYIEWKDRQYEQKLQAVEEKFKQIEEERLIADTRNQWDLMDRDFRDKDPDYAGSMDYLLSRAKSVLKEQNPAATDYEINQYIKQLEYQDVGNAAAAGLSPSSYFKTKAREAGYNPSQSLAATKPKSNSFQKAKSNQKRGVSSIGRGVSRAETPIVASDVTGGNMDLRQILSINDSDWRNMPIE